MNKHEITNAAVNINPKYGTIVTCRVAATRKARNKPKLKISGSMEPNEPRTL